MIFDPTTALKYLQTDLGKRGYFSGGVLIGEPFGPPNDMAAALFFMAFDPPQTTLATTIDVWTLQVRIYARAGMSPENAETVELALANAFAQFMADVAGSFTLGGAVRAVDWAGEEAGHKVGAKWGHLDVSGTIFRVIDVTVPLIVDDSATFAA